MLDLLTHLYHTVVPRKHQAFCVHCKTVKSVKTIRYVNTESKGTRTIRRAVGECPDCAGKTSVIVG